MKNIFTNKIVYDNLTSDIKFDIEKFDFTDYKLSNSEVSNVSQFDTNKIASKLKNLSTNPASGLTNGQIWYNTSTKELKLYGWAPDPNFTPYTYYDHGPNMSYYKFEHCSVGSPSSSNVLAIGGRGGLTSNYSTFARLNVTEEYNGTSFSASTNLLNVLNNAAATGNSNSAYIFGGKNSSSPTNTTQNYNGTSWSYGANLNQSRESISGDGSTTACMVLGGYASFGSWLNTTEEYNGTSWQNSVNFPISAQVGHVLGVANAYLCKVFNSTYGFDGTSFIALSNFPDDYETYGRAAAIGNLFKAHIIGGGGGSLRNTSPYDSYSTTLVREWNGISWSYMNNIPQSREDTSGSGSTSAGSGMVTGGWGESGYINTGNHYNTTLMSFLDSDAPDIQGIFNINFET